MLCALDSSLSFHRDSSLSASWRNSDVGCRSISPPGGRGGNRLHRYMAQTGKIMLDTNYAAIVLAAGRSTRFGGPKLSAMLDGAPVLSHALRSAMAAPATRRVLVTRDDHCAEGFETVQVDNDALSASLRAGLAAIDGCAGAFIFLGDMPRIPADVPCLLAAGIGDGLAAYPVFQDRPGHPLLLAARGFALAQGLAGDRGLGALLHDHPDVVRVPVDHAGVVSDVDSPDDLARMQSAGSGT